MCLHAMGFYQYLHIYHTLPWGNFGQIVCFNGWLASVLSIYSTILKTWSQYCLYTDFYIRAVRCGYASSQSVEGFQCPTKLHCLPHVSFGHKKERFLVELASFKLHKQWLHKPGVFRILSRIYEMQKARYESLSWLAVIFYLHSLGASRAFILYLHVCRKVNIR